MSGIKPDHAKKLRMQLAALDTAIDGADCPLPIETIPNYMGVNLCSVEAISWKRQDDNQLVNLTIHFTPNNDNL